MTGERKDRHRPRPVIFIASAVIGAFVLAVLSYMMFRSGGEGGTGPGRPAPAIELTDFEGKTFSLADYRGRPVVVNFWASWCPSCVAEMPDFERVHASLGDRVAFVGINHSDNRSTAERLARETGVTYRLVEDPDGRAFRAFGGLGMPATAFVDAEGEIVEVVVGQLSAAQLEDYIDRSFEGAADV